MMRSQKRTKTTEQVQWRQSKNETEEEQKWFLFHDVEPTSLWIYNNKKLRFKWVRNDLDFLNEE